MEDTENKYRISTFKEDNSLLVCWNVLPDNVVEEIHPAYFTNCRFITKDNEIDSRTYIILNPVKRFRKNETVVRLSGGIYLGLDDY